MSVNFHIDRYSSGKYSSYDKFRARHNNRNEILPDPEKRKNQSNVKQTEDTFAAEKLSSSSDGQGLLDYGQALNIPFTYPYP